MKNSTRKSKTEATKTPVVARKTIKMHIPKFETTRYGRSALTGLSKFAIADLIVQQTPGQGYAQIIDTIRTRKGRVHEQRMLRASETRSQTIDQLVKLPREILVDLSYACSDIRLNTRYKGVPHNTVPDDNHGEKIEKEGYALKDPRPLDLPANMTTWEREWKKRKKRGIQVKFKRAKKKAPAPRRQANDITEVKVGRKVRPVANWIAALRSHNAYLAHEAEFKPKAVKENKPTVKAVDMSKISR